MSYLTDCINTINKNINVQLSINNKNALIYDFDRYIPNKFRYYDVDKFNSYEEQLYSLTDDGYCARQQLINGTPRVWNLTKIIDFTLPYENDPDADEKNLLRNQFFKYCLICEKAYIFYKQFKRICGSYIVPWDASFYITVNPSEEFAPIVSERKAYEFPIPFYELVSMFNTASVYSNITENDFASHNALSPNIDTLFTYVTMPELIYFSLQYLVSIVHISTMVLQGKTPAVSPNYLNHFTPSLCRGYINEYTIILQTRDQLYGFKPGFGFSPNNILN